MKEEDMEERADDDEDDDMSVEDWTTPWDEPGSAPHSTISTPVSTSTSLLVPSDPIDPLSAMKQQLKKGNKSYFINVFDLQMILRCIDDLMNL